VAGYGWCGRGLASRLSGLGANVIVTEINPTRALEAVMDGYLAMPMEEAARVADLIITVTGNLNVLDRRHFEVMKDGVVIANTGHFNDEINIPALESISSSRTSLRDFVEQFDVDGRKIYLLAEGRLPTRRCPPSICSRKRASSRPVYTSCRSRSIRKSRV
jgi:adenosylhomocysteinase